ncbi:hypothetical protein BKA60DRAFT_687484 [Fusarium oxysporum]|nr:hypothetical protein BKA60DRAFT_687484 [Fusarium oxysporum]
MLKVNPQLHLRWSTHLTAKFNSLTLFINHEFNHSRTAPRQYSIQARVLVGCGFLLVSFYVYRHKIRILPKCMDCALRTFLTSAMF